MPQGRWQCLNRMCAAGYMAISRGVLTISAFSQGSECLEAPPHPLFALRKRKRFPDLSKEGQGRSQDLRV